MLGILPQKQKSKTLRLAIGIWSGGQSCGIHWRTGVGGEELPPILDTEVFCGACESREKKQIAFPSE
jgi:hypothetical protein